MPEWRDCQSQAPSLRFRRKKSSQREQTTVIGKAPTAPELAAHPVRAWRPSGEGSISSTNRMNPNQTRLQARIDRLDQPPVKTVDQPER